MTTARKVKPSTALILMSMPCEKQAAAIRNKTLDAIELGDAIKVARRYLQSREGQRNTLNESVVHSLLTTFCLAFGFYLKSKNNDLSKFSFWIAIFSALNIPPNVHNTMRYKTTSELCKKWLVDQLGLDKFHKLEKLSYDLYKFAVFARKELPTCLVKPKAVEAPEIKGLYDSVRPLL